MKWSSRKLSLSLSLSLSHIHTLIDGNGFLNVLLTATMPKKTAK
jgi:hypothetical protein